MAWTEPKINWNENYEPSPEDMNRIEENTYALKNEGMEIDGEKTFKEDATFEKDVEVGGDSTVDGNATVDGNITVGGGASVGGTVSASKVDTGHGDNELYPMNQAVRTTDKVEFTFVNAPHLKGYFHGTRNGDELFSLLAPRVPNTNDQMAISGGIRVEALDEVYIVSRIKRDSSSKINVYGLRTNDGTPTIINVTDGGSFEYELSISW